VAISAGLCTAGGLAVGVSEYCTPRAKAKLPRERA
jgi:hypothetical protein